MRPIQRAPGQLSGQKRRSGLPPPPDPENASPGAVATATGAEIQTSVLRRATSQYRNRHAYVQSAGSAALAVCNEQDRIGSVAEYDDKRHARDVAPRIGTRKPLPGIRQNCLWCCNGSAHEVAVCAAKACPTWPFRFGQKRTDEIYRRSRGYPDASAGIADDGASVATHPRDLARSCQRRRHHSPEGEVAWRSR
jgi:hypothetical protein